MRAWLLTNTAYGTWLPGDPRGSVTSVRDMREEDEPAPSRFEHDAPGESYEDPLPGLRRSAIEKMNGPPIYLNLDKALAVLAQFQETATIRKWTLKAVAIMANHFHLVVTTEDDPSPKKILADFKAYASRVLNRRHGQPPSETWWTTNGSKRKLRNEQALADAIHYVLYNQPYPWPSGAQNLGASSNHAYTLASGSAQNLASRER
jgi:REP element-mobilizing transposase RayT